MNDDVSNPLSLETDPEREPRTLYKEIAEELAQRIASGGFPPGSALPSERKIAEQRGVSRVTIRQAIAQLVREGLVEQRRGSGTYVTQRVSQQLSVLTSFSENVAARGMVAESEVINCGVSIANPEEVIGLSISPSTRVSRIERLRRADGQPLAIESATIVHDALPDPAAVGASLYATLEMNGQRPVRAVQRLSAIALDARTADLLATKPGAPGLLIIRIGYASDRRPVEYTRSTFRGDRWDIVTEVT